MDNNAIFIVYASEGGNAKQLAEDFAKRCSDLSICYELLTLNAFSEQPFAKSRAVFFVSTTGTGEFPANGCEFEESSLLQTSHLSGFSYTIFALGNPSYSQFCGAGKTLQQVFLNKSAVSLQPMVLAGANFLELYASWALKVLVQLSGLSEQELKTSLAEFAQKPTQLYQVKQRICLTAPQSESETYHLVLATEQEPLPYQLGDVIAIEPVNEQKKVDALLTLLELTPDDTIEKHGELFTVESFLLNKVEITKINESVIKKTGAILHDWALLTQASSSTDVEALQAQYDLYHWLQKYPIPKEEITSFMAELPEKSPRYYSIASDPQISPKELHLTVALHTQHFDDRGSYGLGSGALCQNLPMNTDFSVSLESHPSFHLQTQQPMIWIAVGTGVAPFIGFLSRIMQLFPSDRPHITFYYGVRSEEEDFLYGDFLTKCAEEGVIDLQMSFSRSGPSKRYVQHVMVEQMEKVSALIAQNAHLYICGSQPMWQEVETVIQHSVLQVQEDMEAAKEYWTELSETRMHKEIY